MDVNLQGWDRWCVNQSLCWDLKGKVIGSNSYHTEIIFLSSIFAYRCKTTIYVIFRGNWHAIINIHSCSVLIEHRVDKWCWYIMETCSTGQTKTSWLMVPDSSNLMSLTGDSRWRRIILNILKVSKALFVIMPAHYL